jgi:hypothetical protein
VNLRLFGSVIWRFRILVGVGAVLGFVLAISSVAKFDPSRGFPPLAPRTPHTYSSSATLLVTQSGFPWGSAVQTSATTKAGLVPSGDLGRLTALANLYVQVANSDMIQRSVARMDPPGGMVSATQDYSYSPSFYSTALPIVTITGTGASTGAAMATAQAGVDALDSYLRQQQNAAGISDAERVVLQEMRRPRTTTVLNPTKKTIPVVVFLTVMMAVIGLAFVLENLRPRTTDTVVLAERDEPRLGDARRSA